MLFSPNPNASLDQNYRFLAKLGSNSTLRSILILPYQSWLFKENAYLSKTIIHF